MGELIGKWTMGSAYGPCLTSTQLYLLQAAEGLNCLELNPVLTHSLKSFHLVLNLANGQSGGYDNADQGKDLPFTCQDEPATIPRVTELYIVCKLSPWITHVKATSEKKGVSMGDIVNSLWATYGEHDITTVEWNALNVRDQERARRANIQNMIQSNPSWQGGYPFSPPSAHGDKLKRSAWLKDKIFFDGLEVDDDYSMKRLGFKAPNIFTMSLCG